MEFRILGPLQVLDGGRAVEVAGPKQRTLLAALVLHAGRVVAKDRLFEVLWGPQPPVGALATLHSHVSHLRRVLDPESPDRRGGLIVAREPGYVLTADPHRDVDAGRFEALAAEGKRALATGAPAEASAVLARALALWRGEPLAEFTFAPFAQAEIARLGELRLQALEDRIEADLAIGRPADLVGELRTLVGEQPLRERLWAQLMLALYRSGRQADALRAYAEVRHLLGEQLGIEPSPHLACLEEAILLQKPELDWGPPAAPAGRTAPVVTPLTSFVGRDHEVAEVIAHLAGTRLLTVVGPGGVGKTRLALQVAAKVAGTFPDGVAVCELAGVADPEAVVPAVATALGVQRRPDRSLEASVTDVLRTTRMMLVVDNCEHVVEAAASLLATLVAMCPHTVVLATSRERLGIEGEQVWRLGPLEAAAAVELFCDRARAVRPHLACKGPTSADVAQICDRLDGLPLAIELAAAQVAAMNPADLVRRLDDRLRLLDGRPRSGPTRHRSLRALVDWSYERLGQSRRQVFDRLSVFAGSFTLEDAEEFCAGDEVDGADVAAIVADLVEVSMVTMTGGAGVARYRLLETLRAYGQARLEREGVADRLRERHTDYCVALARRADAGLVGQEEGHWVGRLDAQLDDLRAAHRWAISHHDAERALALSVALHGYAYRTLRPEVFAWAEAASRLPEAAGHPLLPLALGSAANGAWNRGDLAAARQLAEEGVAAAAGAPSGHLALQWLASVAALRGDLDGARELSRRSAELAEAFGDGYQALIYRMVEILTQAYGGQIAVAVGQAEAAVRDRRPPTCPSARAWALYVLGETLLDHDPVRAIAVLDESQALAATAGHTFLVGLAGTSAVTLRARHEDPEDALRRFLELIDLWHRAGNWSQQWTMLRSLITTLARIGCDESAAVLYGALQASPTAPPVFGADAEHLADALHAMEDRAGRHQVASWIANGRQLSEDEVIEMARTSARSPGQPIEQR